MLKMLCISFQFELNLNISMFILYIPKSLIDRLGSQIKKKKQFWHRTATVKSVQE